jgi:hypothetical protein
LEKVRQFNVYSIITTPFSDEERKKFVKKFACCQRFEVKRSATSKDVRRVDIKWRLERLKALDKCPNKDNDAYRVAADYRDEILASVAATGDYSGGTFELTNSDIRNII